MKLSKFIGSRDFWGRLVLLFLVFLGIIYFSFVGIRIVIAKNTLQKTVNSLQLHVARCCSLGIDEEFPSPYDMRMLRYESSKLLVYLNKGYSNDARQQPKLKRLRSFAYYTLEAEFALWDSKQWSEYYEYAKPILGLNEDSESKWT